MALSRHFIWTDVAYIYEHLVEKNPFEGQEPVVEIYLSGREVPVVASVVETRRDANYPWVRIYTGERPAVVSRPT